MSINLNSNVFKGGQAIPSRYTGDGEDVSPAVAWSGLPEGTKELALIMDDPDAPSTEPWVHWLIYKIPADTNGLSEGISPKNTPNGMLQGKNSWGTSGYRGPAPPRGHGVHHYHFKLYALDMELPLKPDMDKSSLLHAISDHILADGELIGTYQR